ncbi:MAG: SPOR domain-containing protein [Thermodesulfobacteriota bacterium]
MNLYCYLAALCLAFWGYAPSVMAGESIYSVQAGIFSTLKNAQRYYQTLEKSLPANLQEYLRIEKKEKKFVVKVGRFDTLEKAEERIAALRPFSKDAFILKDPLLQGNILKIKRTPPLTPPKSEAVKIPPQSPDDQGTFPEKAEEKPTAEKIKSLLLNKTAITGVLQEIVSIRSDSIGLPPGREMVRIRIRLEETGAIDTFPNILKEKEGQILTLFSETNQNFFIPGKRIKGTAEYKGDHLSRMFWILDPKPLSP